MSPTDLCTMVVLMRGIGELQAIGLLPSSATILPLGDGSAGVCAICRFVISDGVCPSFAYSEYIEYPINKATLAAAAVYAVRRSQ